MRILDYFVYSPAPDIDVMNICRELKLSRKTVDKAMRTLTQAGLIYASRKVGKSIMYKKNPKLMDFANLTEDFIKGEAK